MLEISDLFFAIPLAILLLFIATIAFDVVHYLLHIFAQSNIPVLRSLGALHNVHHAFLDRDLQIHNDKITANVFCHVIPEFIIQVLVTLALGIIFPVEAVIVALLLETTVFLLILMPTSGFDLNHHPVGQLKAYRPLYFCLPEYHLLHHAYPDAYFSSWIKTLDHFFRSGTSLTNRQITITGSDNGFGKAFYEKLRNEKCKVTKVTLGNTLNKKALEPILKKSDILVLTHAPQTEKDYQQLIEFFYSLHKDRRIPVEVWATGDIDEFSNASAGSFIYYAKHLFSSGQIIYRHLVLNQYKNEIDPWTIKQLFKRIKKGYNYVPGYLTPKMLDHYRRFLFH